MRAKTIVKKIPATCATTRLERIAFAWLNEGIAYGYESGATGRFEDLQHGGCISGIVGDLIYSHDCRTFLKRHRDEINAMLAAAIEESGASGPATCSPSSASSAPSSRPISPTGCGSRWPRHSRGGTWRSTAERCRAHRAVRAPAHHGELRQGRHDRGDAGDRADRQD